MSMKDFESVLLSGVFANIGGFIIYTYACFKVGTFIGRFIPFRILAGIWASIVALALALYCAQAIGEQLTGGLLITLITPIVISLLLFIIQEVRRKN